MRKLFYFSYLIIAGMATHAQTGIGTTSPNSTLDVRGAMALALRTVSSSTTLTYTDNILVFNGSANETATLPDATTCEGRTYWIKNANTTLPLPVLTVNTTASQTIDGQITYTIDEPNEVIRVISNGSNWEITLQDVPVAKATTFGGAWNQGGNSVKTTKNLGTINNIDFPFITNNIETMRLTANGFLGLGTNNPQGRWHIVNDNDDAGNDYSFTDYMNGINITQGFFVKKSSGTFATPGNLSNGDTIGQFRFAPRNNGSLNRSMGSGFDAVYKGDGITALTDFRFFTSGTEKMRINENGKISIGTQVPDGSNPEKLLVDAGTTGSYNVISGKGEVDNYLQMNIQNKSSGNVASTDLVATADNGNESDNYIDLGINSSGYNAGPYPIMNGLNQPYLFATGEDFFIGNGTVGRDLILFTGGVATTNERMRIAANGNVGIGQIAAPSEKLTVAGIISPSADNTYTLGTSTNRWSEVWAANGVIQTSDAGMKTNISSLNYGINELMRLRPVSYRWKSFPKERKIGLIAQETQQVIPEVVMGIASKGKLGVIYPELVSVLIKSIQQQQEKLKELKAELDALNN
jgi:hypothetical protein